MKQTVAKPTMSPIRIPLCRPYISEEEELAATEVLRSGWLMQGPKVAEFERLVAACVGTKHAIAVNSGTSALTLAFMAVGLNAGDKVIMPSHSFVATANCAVHRGGEPVFVDVARGTYNLDPSKIESAVDSRTRAIVVVHQFGFAADMDPILKIADKHGLIVIEDAACSLGSTYRGHKTGSFGAAACLSFHPRKIITTGEGGMVLTDSDEVARSVRSLRNHGIAASGETEQPGCGEAGYNHRLTDIQAAIGIAQLERLDEIISLRTRLAGRYRETISKMSALGLPQWPDGSVPNYQSFVVEVADDSIDRDTLLARMVERGIECTPGIQPIHQEPAYAGRYSDDNLHETLRAARRSFFLPLYPTMTDDEQQHVISSLQKAIAGGAVSKEAR